MARQANYPNSNESTEHTTLGKKKPDPLSRKYKGLDQLQPQP